LGGTSLGPAACSLLGQASGGGIFPFGSTVADGLGDLGDGQGGPITFLVNTGVPEPELGEWQPVEPEVVAMPKPDVRPLPAVETVRLEEPEQGHSQPKTLQWHREG
jgi:hypothetical protein